MNKTEFAKVKAHPFHHYLGVKDIDAKNGTAKMTITVSKNILNPSGTFHGGVLYTLCDVTAFCGLLSVLEEGAIGVTNHISIQVLRAAKLGDRITFQSKVVKQGKRLAFLECKATVEHKIIATANVTKTLLVLNT